MNVKTQKILNLQLAPPSLSLINQSRQSSSRCLFCGFVSAKAFVFINLDGPPVSRLLQGDGNGAHWGLQAVSSREFFGQLIKLFPALSLLLDM